MLKPADNKYSYLQRVDTGVTYGVVTTVPESAYNGQYNRRIIHNTVEYKSLWDGPSQCLKV